MSNANLEMLYQVSVEVPLESEDAVLEMFIRLYGNVMPSAWQLHESNRTCASFFALELPKEAKLMKREIKEQLQIIADSGLDVSEAKISIHKIKKENWAESWKRHFKVLTFGDKLMLAPSWSRRKAAKGMVRLILDPGLSFGTGHHPTTSYCLSQIVKYLPAEGGKKSMLDVGCGTGILAIAARALGYSPVFAFDNDEEAVENSIKNATTNNLQNSIDFKAMGVENIDTQDKNQWDLVCANLEAPLLREVAEKIASKVKPDGVLVVAGILTHQFESVQEVYARYGFKVIETWTGGEWTSGTLKRA